MQLSFGLKFAPCVKKLKEVQKERATVNLFELASSVRNTQTSSNFLFLLKTVCATTNRLKLCSFVKNVKKTTTRQNILIVSLKAWAKNGAQLLIYLVLKSEKFMQKRMRKSRFSLNCLVRSETSRHVQICFISAKQCAQLQIAKN